MLVRFRYLGVEGWVKDVWLGGVPRKGESVCFVTNGEEDEYYIDHVRWCIEIRSGVAHGLAPTVEVILK